MVNREENREEGRLANRIPIVGEIVYQGLLDTSRVPMRDYQAKAVDDARLKLARLRQ